MVDDKPIVISLGGSLVVPNGGIDTKFCIQFNRFIRNQIAQKRRFFIVVGGGSLARHYIQAAKDTVGNITDWDLDWLGIHSTRLNAHLIRTIFHDVAHPRIVENYEKKIVDLKEPLVIASGWKPGHSTDYDAVVLARDYQAEMIINMSNTSLIYDKDPNKYKDAKPLHRITWEEFEKLIDDKWSPGTNSPFDPLATKLAKKLGLTLYSIGSNLDNLSNLLNQKTFIGTVVYSNNK